MCICSVHGGAHVRAVAVARNGLRQQSSHCECPHRSHVPTSPLQLTQKGPHPHGRQVPFSAHACWPGGAWLWRPARPPPRVPLCRRRCHLCRACCATAATRSSSSALGSGCPHRLGAPEHELHGRRRGRRLGEGVGSRWGLLPRYFAALAFARIPRLQTHSHPHRPHRSSNL